MFVLVLVSVSVFVLCCTAVKQARANIPTATDFPAVRHSLATLRHLGRCRVQSMVSPFLFWGPSKQGIYRLESVLVYPLIPQRLNMVPVERRLPGTRATTEDDEFQGTLSGEKRRIFFCTWSGVQIEGRVKWFLKGFGGCALEELLRRFEIDSNVCCKPT